MSPVRAEVNAWVLRGVFSGYLRLVGMCEERYQYCDRLETFVDHEGVAHHGLGNPGEDEACVGRFFPWWWCRSTPSCGDAESRRSANRRFEIT